VGETAHAVGVLLQGSPFSQGSSGSQGSQGIQGSQGSSQESSQGSQESRGSRGSHGCPRIEAKAGARRAEIAGAATECLEDAAKSRRPLPRRRDHLDEAWAVWAVEVPAAGSIASCSTKENVIAAEPVGSLTTSGQQWTPRSPKRRDLSETTEEESLPKIDQEEVLLP